jgi:hypothetical protein
VSTLADLIAAQRSIDRRRAKQLEVADLALRQVSGEARADAELRKRRELLSHPRLRQLRADYLRDLRRMRRLVRLPPHQLLQLLAAEREHRYERELAAASKRIEAATASASPAVGDDRLRQLLERFRTTRPREWQRLTTLGLALRLQQAEPALAGYSADWLRQRIALLLKEAMPPASQACGHASIGTSITHEEKSHEPEFHTG